MTYGKEHQNALRQEMCYCLRDLREYNALMQQAQQEGNTAKYRTFAEQHDRARRQYNTAKTEYVNIYGPGGVPTSPGEC